MRRISTPVALRGHRRAIGATTTAVLLLFTVGLTGVSRAAEPTFEPSLSVRSDDLRAGASPDKLSFKIDKPSDNAGWRVEDELQVRTVSIKMDRGVMGNPQAATICDFVSAQNDSCASTSEIGTIDAKIDAQIYRVIGGSNVRTWTFPNFPTTGKVYMAPPHQSAAASLWMVIDPQIQRIGWTGCYTAYPIGEVCKQALGDGSPTDSSTYDVSEFENDIPSGANTEEVVSVSSLEVKADPVVVRVDISVDGDLSVRTEVSEAPRQIQAEAQARIWNRKPYLGQGGIVRYTGATERYKRGWDPDGGFPWVPANAYFDIREMDLALNGKKGASLNRHFLTNSTDCGPDVFNATFTSWPLLPEATATFPGTKSKFGSTSLNITDCAALPFAPQSPISLSTYNTGDVPKIDIAIRQSYGEAHMKSVSMTLPKFFVNIDNLVTCDDSLAVHQCPAGSNLGTAVAKSPISPNAFTGNLYLRSPRSDGTLGMTISLNGRVGNQAIPIEIPLSARIDAANGVVSATSGELPQVPISEFQISIDDKQGGSIFRNALPGRYPYSVSFEGWNGATHTYSSSIDIGGTVRTLETPDADLSIDLSTSRTKAYTALDAEYELKDPQKLKTFKLKLGNSKKKTLKASTKQIMRLSRTRRYKKRGFEIGTLLIKRKKESRRVRLLAKRGRIKAYPSKGTAKSFKRKIRKAKGKKKASLKRAYSRYKKDVKKLQFKIKSRYLQIKRLPTKYALKKIELSLTDRGKFLRNPSKKSTVTFTASTDRKNKATDEAKIKKAKKKRSKK